MISSLKYTSRGLFNFFRYFFAFLIIFIIFYTPSVIIENKYIEEAIDKNIPFKKIKKNREVTITEFKINHIKDKIVYLNVYGKLKYKKKIFGIKASKTFKFLIDTAVIPVLNKNILTFELVHLKIKKNPFQKFIKNVLKEKIKKKRVKIKALKKYENLTTIKNIEFLDNGDLLVNYKLTKWLLLLVLIFMFFETKYILSFLKPSKQ